MKILKTILIISLIGIVSITSSFARGGEEVKEEKAEEAVAEKDVTGGRIFQYATIAEYEKATGKKIRKFNEAPILEQKVAAGEIPELEKRLPKEPLVIVPLEETGQYGGTWRKVDISITTPAFLMQGYHSYESLFRYSRDVTGIVPNLAKSWDVSEDGKVFTIYLREGVKWSDGEPFTADDFMFWYEDIVLNDELTPTKPDYLKPGEELGKIEKVDDYTIRFSFDVVYGLFFEIFAFRSPYIYSPKHYLSKFHPSYASKDELAKLTKEAGFDNWYQLFKKKNNPNNTDRPAIWPWTITKIETSRVIAERNPFYWKVDTEGNQLPYIDRIVFDIVQSVDMVNLKAMTGEIDYQFRYLSFDNYTLYKKSEQEGNYRVLEWKDVAVSKISCNFNLNHKDPVKRTLFQDKRFRIALSHAINREEINQFIYKGVGKPVSCTLPPAATTPEVEELAKSYLKYDPEKTNKLLDEIGLTEKDKDGYRLLPDGRELFIIMPITTEATDIMDSALLIKDYWEAVGIKAEARSMTRELWEQRAESGELDMWVGGRGALPTPYLDPEGFLPTYERVSARQWTYWSKSKGETGEKPTGDALRATELWQKQFVTVDPDERLKLLQEVVKIHTENLWYIGIVGGFPVPGVATNRFRNCMETAWMGYYNTPPGMTAPEQFFIKQ